MSLPPYISNATSSARCTPLTSTRLHFSPVLVPSARFLAFPRPAPSAVCTIPSCVSRFRIGILIASQGTSKTHIHPEYSLFSAASRQLGLEERYIKVSATISATRQRPQLNPETFVGTTHDSMCAICRASICRRSVRVVQDNVRIKAKSLQMWRRHSQTKSIPRYSWLPSAPYRVFSESIALEIDVAGRR
ncbi:hypothetical protein B0H13DRAFT_2673133 [Mycena leptocephala]|nr:hypothetical protein B0H13DRAFT_2673133 [Mycena leptocephala]